MQAQNLGSGKDGEVWMHLKYLGILAWMLADMQMNDNVSNAHSQWFSYQKIKADNHDIIK